jgi:BlaI family transcriptional regulator, penicillinase repressor
MTDPTRPPVSDAERQVLQVLWEHGPGTVREVQERLKETGCDWQRSTVITLLQRLEAKGYVDSDKSSHAFVFHAAVSRDELVHQRMCELANEFCDGNATPLLLSFAQRQRFSESELAELRRLIDDLAARADRSHRKHTRGDA